MMHYRIVENTLGNFMIQSATDLAKKDWLHCGDEEFQNLKEARARRDRFIAHDARAGKAKEVKRVVE